MPNWNPINWLPLLTVLCLVNANLLSLKHLQHTEIQDNFRNLHANIQFWAMAIQMQPKLRSLILGEHFSKIQIIAESQLEWVLFPSPSIRTDWETCYSLFRSMFLWLCGSTILKQMWIEQKKQHETCPINKIEKTSEHDQ